MKTAIVLFLVFAAAVTVSAQSIPAHEMEFLRGMLQASRGVYAATIPQTGTVWNNQTGRSTSYTVIPGPTMGPQMSIQFDSRGYMHRSVELSPGIVVNLD